jgi:uncharacterized iron-regulated membrane protein
MKTELLPILIDRTQRLPWCKLWLTAHLWLALVAGLFFAIIGVTGSISLYRDDIDHLLNPQLVISQPQGQRQSLDKIMLAVRKAHPERYGAWTLEMPSSPNEMLTAWYDKPRETYFELYAPLMVSVNPYTAEVVASRFWGQTMATWLMDIHTQLLMGLTGWQLVGGLGLLLMLSVSSGVYLWWPGRARLLASITLNYRKPMIALLFDVHRLLGVLLAPGLLVLASTGVMLSYPQVFEDLVGTSGMAHGETGKNITSTGQPNDHPTALESAEFMARGSFPKSSLRRITTPAGNEGVYRINLRQKGEINLRHPYTTVWVDRWSGQVKEVRDPYRFSTGETMLTWVWPLHTAEALGAKGRLLWFVSGFGLAFLYISGLLRWLLRRGVIQDRIINWAAMTALMSKRWRQLQPRWLQLQQHITNGLVIAKPYLQHLQQWVLQKLLQLWGRLMGQRRLK